MMATDSMRDIIKEGNDRIYEIPYPFKIAFKTEHDAIVFLLSEGYTYSSSTDDFYKIKYEKHTAIYDIEYLIPYKKTISIEEIVLL